MTCIDDDVHRSCLQIVQQARLPCLNYDAVYYTDDTVIFSTHPQALNELIKHVEDFSGQYGLQLNKAKCSVLHMNKDATVVFADNALMPKAQEAVYLGNNLNHKVSIRREVCQRIADVKRTWLKLHAYWTDTTASKKWQLSVYDAVILSRFLYGLEAIHLTKSLCRKLNAFHHKGLRKILRLTTTLVSFLLINYGKSRA